MGKAKILTKGGSTLPVIFSYTGTYNVSFREVNMNGKTKIEWELKLLTSGTLKFSRIATRINDIFLVGGGGGGGTGRLYASIGACGGGGGYVTNRLNISISKFVDYPVAIGAGGVTKASGGTTTALGIKAAGGKPGEDATTANSLETFGGEGGSGGGGAGLGSSGNTNYYGGVGGKGQNTTTRAFGEGTGILYAGGGGGAPCETAQGGDGGSDGRDGQHGGNYNSGGGSGAGGVGGGGNYDTDGTQNTGGGGGGGYSSSYSANPGGSGGSGIVIIRGRYV